MSDSKDKKDYSKDDDDDVKDEKDTEIEIQDPEDTEAAAKRPILIAERAKAWVQQSRYSDVVFLVGKEEKKIIAHRVILAVASPVFEAMLLPKTFEGDKEEEIKLPLEVKLPNDNADAFVEMLKCIYSDELVIDLTFLNELVKIASKFEIEKLADLCSDAMSNDVTLENAFELFGIVAKLHADPTAILEFISDNSDTLLTGDVWTSQSEETIKVLLKQDTLGMEEFPLFKAVLAWGEAECKRQKLDKKNLKDVLKEVLPLLRFPLFSTSEIAQIASSGLLSQDEMVSLFSYSSISDESAKKKVKLPWNSTPREGSSFLKGSKLVTSKHKKDFLKFFEATKKYKFGLLYQASKDGFGGSTFHAKCDAKGPTITIIKSAMGHIFGGYSADSWNTNGAYSTMNAWLYVLDNPSHTPCKFTQTSNSYGAYGYSSYGPTWGSGHDLMVSGSMRDNSSYCNPSAYSLASGWSGSYSNSTLAGSYNFTVVELEVWTVTEAGSSSSSSSSSSSLFD